jgi:hypothetical protein
VVDLVEVAVLKGKLILGPAEPAADIDVLRRLHEQSYAFDLRELRPQSIDDLAGARIALVARLEIDEHPAIIDGLIDTAGSDRGDDAVDPRLFEQNPDQAGLTLDHGRKGDVLGCFRDRDDEAGVLLRKEALGNDHVEVSGEDDGSQGGGEGDPPMTKGPLQSRLIGGQHVREDAFSEQIEATAALLSGFPQQLRAHHRRQRQ